MSAAAVADGTAGAANAFSHPQTLDNPFGKIIRINPLQDGADPYSIPATNPFDDDGPVLDNDGLAEEIYALGFRDQQTFSFAKDGNGETVLVTFDIGESLREEVDLVRSGGNYGWSRWEGTNVLQPGAPLSSTPTPPVLEYNHATGGFAIIGGFLVSDPSDPTFQEQVIFSDLVNGKMFHADYGAMLDAEQTATQATIFEMTVEFEGDTGKFADVLDHIDGGRGDARFGADEDGRLFIVSKQTDKIFDTGLVISEGFDGLNGVAGDVNQDGNLDQSDIDDFILGWRSVTVGLDALARTNLGDLNLSGETDFNDFWIFRGAWGGRCRVSCSTSSRACPNLAR